ncbi:peptidoglycan DD-metalloendopeptidase family protein [Enterococcus faecium]|uniref:peptidoglycan DD-metalloendopeptidase family protein n=1 Tax=Enterococcus faecium TaxID=1352 RepID=UPI0035A016DC
MSAVGQAVWNGVTATARGIANGYRLAIAALSTSQTIQALKTKIAATATTAWTAVTKGAALATKGLGLAIRFMTGPVGIVITAIGLLVAGLIHLWKTNSSFRNSVITAWTAIKNAAVAIFGFIKTHIVAIWNVIKASTITVWNGIKTVAVATWNGIKLAILHPIRTLKTILSTIWNAMKNSAIKIWTALKNGVIAIIKAYVAQVKFNINLIKRIVVTIFNAIKSFSIKVWTALKNGVLGIVRALRKGVLSVFNALKKGVSVIFNAVKNATVRIWTVIKNSVVNKAKALWSGVKNTWNALKKGTIGIFKVVGSFMSSKWNSIKNDTVNKAKALWSGVKGAWGSLKKGTHNTMSAVGGFMSKKWNGIKNTTVSIVNSMKSKVMGTMNKMRDGIKTVTGKIGNLFGGMVKGVKKGLNKLISGVNWVADKLGMDKLPSIKLSTGTNASKKYVSHGKINRDTFATVGDKGGGNGPSGFRHEMIEYPNGKTTITPNRDTTTFLPKGSKVYNGTQTHAMLSQMPRFSIGSAIKEKAEYMLENGKKAVKSTVGKGKDLGGNAVDQVKKVGSEVAVKAKKVGSAVISGIGDVFDYIGHPGKLVNKIFDKVGFNFNFLKDAPLPFDLMQGAYKKLKSGVKSLFDEWLNDAGGGDGSSFTKFPITTGYYPNGGAPGYSFGGGHHYGIDFGAPYGTTINATNSGQLGELHNFGGGLVARLLTGQFTLFFMHLSKILKHGKVQAGEPIAKTGNSGNWTTGPHLHFQVEKGRHNDITNQNTVNPLKWLKGHGGGKVGGSGSANARRAIQRAQSILGGRYKSSYITEQMMRVAKRESNFQAGAVNNWDSNARAGIPSKGMFQMIEPSFRAFAKPGHGNILNPVDEAISAMRYIVAKYGWGGFKRAGDYAYATGGLINTAGLYNLAEDGYPEIVIPTDPSRQSDAMKLLHLAASKISGNNRNKRPNQLRTPSVTSNTVDNAELLLQMIENQQKQINVLMEIARSNKTIEKQPKGFSERDVSQAQGSRLRLDAYSQGGL